MESVLGFVSIWGLTSLTLLAGRLLAWRSRLQISSRYFLKAISSFVRQHQQAFWMIAVLLCCTAVFKNNFLKAGVALEAVFLNAFFVSLLASFLMHGAIRLLQNKYLDVSQVLLLQKEQSWGMLHIVFLGLLWLWLQQFSASPTENLYALLSFMMGAVLAYLSFQMYLLYRNNKVLATASTSQSPHESIALGAALAALILSNTFSFEQGAWATFALYVFMWLSALRIAGLLLMARFPQKSAKTILFLQAFLLLGSLLLIERYGAMLPAESLEEEAHFSTIHLKSFLQILAALAFLLHASPLFVTSRYLMYVQGAFLFTLFFMSFVFFGLYGLSLSILLIFVVGLSPNKKAVVVLDSSK